MAQAWRLEPLAEFQDRLTELLDDLLGATPTGEGRFPATELRRGTGGYVLRAALPGVRREDLELTVEPESVTLSGERSVAELPPDAQVVRRERWTGRFRRVVRLPEAVDTKRVRARLTDGILEIDLPVSEAVQPREVVIEVGREGVS